MKELKPNRKRLKVFSHLNDGRTLPSAYATETTALLYHPEKGFSVRNPVTEWYEKRKSECPFNVKNWDQFEDPKQLTYSSYVSIRKDREIHSNKLRPHLEKEIRKIAKNPTLLKEMESTLVPLMYPLHAFQMVAAYVGQMAPSGRIAICAGFQIADELRKIEEIAQLTALIREIEPSFGETRLSFWENDPHFQPLRKTVEELLVCYEWTEAAIALNLCLKPALQQTLSAWAERLTHAGCPSMGMLLQSFEEDERWHQEWMESLIRLIQKEDPTGAEQIDLIFTKWGARSSEPSREAA